MRIGITYRREWVAPDDMVRTFKIEFPDGKTIEVCDDASCGAEKRKIVDTLFGVSERVVLDEQPLSGQEVIHRRGVAEVSEKDILLILGALFDIVGPNL